MPERSSNKASIVVAVVTLLLILGGVYLLNLNMNPSSRNSDSDNSSTVTDTTNDDENEDLTTDITEDLALPEDEEDATTTPTAPELDSNTTTPPTTPTEPTNPTTPPANPDQLSPTQMTARFTGSTNGTSNWEITGCGIPNARFCRAGATMSLVGVEEYTPLTVGQEYLFDADISESDTQFLINIINSVEPIN